VSDIANQAGTSLRTAFVTAAFCGFVSALYVVAGAQPAPVVSVFITFAPLIAVIAWLDRDAQRCGAVARLDWGLFLWAAWPFLLPWYVFRTRGRNGWRLLLGLAALVLAPLIAGVAALCVVFLVRLVL
jgi:hypothetical protein